MAHFGKKPFGKYTSLIYFLLFVAAAEFVGLAGLLIAGSGGIGSASAAWTEPGPQDAVMPEWLEPAEKQVEEKKKPDGERTGPEILSGQRIIAHGMGTVNGRNVLNCKEGFENMYEQGVRVFEADLRMTSDQCVVLRHDWRQGWQVGIRETSIPTLEEFLDSPILGKYTPLSFQDLLLLLEEYPDVCIITDSKFTEPESVLAQFRAMVKDAEELGLSYLLDRFVVQVYNPLMFQVVESVHHFQGYIYTFYLDGFDGTQDAFRERAAFCAENGILGITLEAHLWRSGFAQAAEEYGLAVYTHTVNDLEQARAFLAEGVSGIYTDSLTPDVLAEEPNITEGDV